MAEEFPDFELVPSEAEDLSPDDELADLVDPGVIPDVADDETMPIGRSWWRDYSTELTGFSQLTEGVQSVVMVASVALRTQRGTSIIFDDDFGMSHPESMIGQVDDPEIRSHYIRDVTETLLSCHDRITAVSNINFDYDNDEEVGYLSVDIEIDGEETATLDEVPLNA